MASAMLSTLTLKNKHGSTLFCAEHELEHDGDVIVSYSDIIYVPTVVNRSWPARRISVWSSTKTGFNSGNSEWMIL